MQTIDIPHQPKKILIVKPSSLGDIVHSLPLLNVVKKRFPEAHVHWLVAKGLDALLEGHPMIERLWIIDKDRWKKPSALLTTFADLRHLFRGLRNESYDVVIDLQGLLRSGLMTGATRAPMRIGFKEAREGSVLFYTHTVEGGRQIHAVDRYLKIAAAIGCDTAEVRFPLPAVGDTDATRRIKSGGAYAVLVPGARKEANQWPAERYGELAARLPLRTLIVGAASEGNKAEKIAARSGGKAQSLAGKTDLRELMAILRDAKFVVSNDTGPMHIAAAYRVPVVAIFGPANPLRTGPYGAKHRVVRADVPCAPCYKRRCANRICMDVITVDRVYEAVKDVTSGSANQ